MFEEIVETRLLLDVDVSSDYGSGPIMRLSVAPVGISAEGWARNFTDSWGDQPLADLRITAQADYVSEDAYGWRVEYAQPYSVDLRRAESMLKLLRKVQRGLDKMERELGYAESFGAYVARVGKVLGVKSYGWRAETGETSFQYSDSRFRWSDAVGFALHASQAVRDFKSDSAKVSA